MKQCPKCGNTAPSDMKFCSVCGTALRDASMAAPGVPTSMSAPAESGRTPATPSAARRSQTGTRQAPVKLPVQPAQSATVPPNQYHPAPAYRTRAVAGNGVGRPGTNGLAVTALVCALLVSGWLAVIFGHIARRQCRNRPQRGGGIALAALILGYATVPFNIAFFAALVSPGS
ncbi:DUF4190 domain-containing protein [Curtobacterium sp. MCPF17_031]|uniref:DUF4190 domain-containing protein n=1 Tax=Curtobacterium sp. MCPF17_031 TaxID=2175653 RepID=UPI0015E8A619